MDAHQSVVVWINLAFDQCNVINVVNRVLIHVRDKVARISNRHDGLGRRRTVLGQFITTDGRKQLLAHTEASEDKAAVQRIDEAVAVLIGGVAVGIAGADTAAETG